MKKNILISVALLPVFSGYLFAENFQDIAFEDIERDKIYVPESDYDEDGRVLFLTSRAEREFLNGLIRYFKPKKILEIGVAHGGTSLILLNAAKDIGAKVYGIDIGDKLDGKPIGHIIKEKEPELSKYHHLYTPNITAAFIEEIAKDKKFDFVFIDAAHQVPGELLDFLMVLPYLEENAIVVFHDISCPFSNSGKIAYNCFVTCLAFSNLRGEKFIPKKIDKAPFRYARDPGMPNIGAVRLDSNQEKFWYDYFQILSAKWHYMPSDEHIELMTKFFEKHYGKKYSEMFTKIVENQKYKYFTKHEQH
ncbi:MAG: class I SAM-dependent methyltransferase, partial [Alphaproteobacteria bacterium]|nr:class I SAM-dependent methyltransferase [Alphaproteobacteria bacterium]